MVLQTPPKQSSNRPSLSVLPPTSLMSLVLQVAVSERNENQQVNQALMQKLMPGKVAFKLVSIHNLLRSLNA